MQHVIYLDRSAEFWPEGWMVWACWALAALDTSLVAYLVHLVARHGS